VTCAECSGFFDAAGGVLAPGTALRCHHDHSRHRVASKATRQPETPVAERRHSNPGPIDLQRWADPVFAPRPVSQESFWQIGFDDTVRKSMVETCH
jgi:hypothetical protein